MKSTQSSSFNITENVTAVQDVWFLGNNFFRETFNSFTAMRSHAHLHKVRPPHLFEFYNIFGYCQNVSSMVRGLSHFYNPLIEALNARIKLPKYIILIWDRDFIEHADVVEHIAGAPHTYPMIIEWIISKMENVIHHRKTELIDKKPGAIMLNSPEFIWVKMLKRLKAYAEHKLFSLRGKFNNALENTLLNRKGRIPSYILSIEVDQEEFLPNGDLTSSGKRKFWQEIDSCINKFKRREINLKPKQNKKEECKKTKRVSKTPRRSGHDCYH